MVALVSEQWHLLADAIPHFVWSAQPDGSIEYGNRRLLDYLGRTSKEIRGWTWLSVLHPEDVDRSAAAWQQAVSSGTEYRIEYRIRRASDGDYRWHEGRASALRDEAGRVVRWLGTCTDIHDRKLAEEALRESEERFRRLVEVSSQIVWVTNAQGEPIEDSPSWRAFTGQTLEQWLGWGWLEAVHPEDRARVAEAWRQAVETVSVYRIEFRLIHNGGRYRHFACQAVPVLNPDGSVRRWVGMNVDVTERKQAEANQTLLSEVLQVLNRGGDMHPLLCETVRLIRRESGFDAVGLRLRQGDDCPYFEDDGFSAEFLREENFLCARGGDGSVVRDDAGRAVLECTCGLVLSGRTDPTMPCFTEGGSFWTNVSTELLALPREADPRANPRNRCIHVDYLSVGLFPIRSGGEIIGLLQLNAREAGRFAPEQVTFYEGLAQNLGLALQRLSSEEARRASEERLKRAQEIAHLGSWELDLLTNRLTWSDEVYRIFGLEPQQVPATYEAFLEAVHPDDRAAVDAAYADSLRENRESYEVEHRVVRKSTGEVRLVHEKCEHVRDGSGQIVRSAGMVHDITERAALAESLRHRESTLSQAGKMAQLGAWELEISNAEDLNANPLRWSQEAYRVFGYEPGSVEVTNELFFSLVHPEDRPRIEEAVAQAIALRQPYTLEHRIIRPDGAERILFEHAEITFDEQGRPVHVVGAVQDITERKKAEDTLRSALEAADAANRAKSDFLARMSHELRTPMNGIMGMTELSLMEPELPRRARDFLELARESSKGLLEIINDMLDIAKIEAGRAELVERPFDLLTSVRDLLAPLRHTAEHKGVHLAYRPSEDLPPLVVGDEGRLRQVLTNLVANAVKFTERGEVEVTISASEEPAAPGRSRFLFAVRDTGIGIPPENVCAVFDSFSGATRSTHARYGGTGLGLSIARQLVELMGGRIWVESEPERGSTFRFTAELALPEGATAAVREQGGRSAGGGRLRVLLAEDNPLNQVFARELLQRLGHEVVVAANGAEALSAVSREAFDLVLMDVEMPVLSGEEVTKRIRAGLAGDCPADVPVIALSAHALHGDRERFLASGMDDYISKPFDLARIESVVREVLERRRRSAQGG